MILLALFKIYDLGNLQKSSKELYKMKDFYKKKGEGMKSYGRQKKKVGWLLEGYFPLGDGRGLLARAD